MKSKKLKESEVLQILNGVGFCSDGCVCPSGGSCPHGLKSNLVLKKILSPSSEEEWLEDNE